MNVIEYLAPMLSVLVIAGYHVVLFLRIRRNPLYSMQSMNRRVRTIWVAYIMENESRSILAVQTLRNTTMAATFLASTAVLLMMASLGLISQAEKLTGVFQTLHLSGFGNAALWTWKVLFMVSDFFVAFFSFAMAVRHYNHIGYHVCLPPELQPESHAQDFVAAMLNRAGRYYTIGMRAYYLAVPLIFWLFGPLFLMGASIVIVFVLHAHDRLPVQTTTSESK
jgi:uncharacterized membrane protein